MKHILFLLLLLCPLTAQAQNTPAGSIFAAQCSDLTSADVEFYRQRSDANGNITLTRTVRPREVRDLAALTTLQTLPGVWYDYDSAAPFGGTYPNSPGYWYSKLVTQTPCGKFETWAWNNGDGTLILFAFYNMQANCDANGNHCGQHHFEFYYATADEWHRATG